MKHACKHGVQVDACCPACLLEIAERQLQVDPRLTASILVCVDRRTLRVLNRLWWRQYLKER